MQGAGVHAEDFVSLPEGFPVNLTGRPKQLRFQEKQLENLDLRRRLAAWDVDAQIDIKGLLLVYSTQVLGE